MVRFAGVLAPRSKWRALVVPHPPTATSSAPPPRSLCRAPCDADLLAVAIPDMPATFAPTREQPAAMVAMTAMTAAFAQTLAAQSDAVEIVAPNVLSVAHWARLGDGELYASQPRVDWSTLLRRTFDFDVKQCAKCGGRNAPVANRHKRVGEKK